MRIDHAKLVYVMARQDVKTAELAERAGVSRTSISALRSGKSCKEETVQRVARALGVEVSALR